MPILLAELPGWISDTGSLVLVITGAVGLVTVVTKARWIRWLWRRLISDPITEWQAGVVRAQTEPITVEMAGLRTDLVEHMGSEERLRADDAADRDRRQLEQDMWKEEVRGELVTIKGSIRRVHGRIDDAFQGNPEVRPRGRVTIPTPTHFDAHTSGEWLEELAHHDLTGSVTLDLARTELVDSRGLGAMIKTADRVSIDGGTIRVINAAPNVRRVITRARLEDLLGVEP